jgi:hypothetical protein
MHRISNNSVVVPVLLLLASSTAFCQTLGRASVRIALLGDPVHQVKWTDEAVEKLKTIGFNEVQLNIAWGSRPFDEALDLIDVVTVPGEAELPGTAERQAELKRRVQLAQRHGLRMLFHFGSPFMDRNPYTGEVPRIPYRIDNVTYDSWYDILNPKVTDHELALLREFRRQFPDVEDILVYSYDQDAWQTPEFKYNKFSYGIPLTERLPGYLALLHRAWTEGRSGKAHMWWEPWELSAGQVYEILPKLPRTDFGLIIHSNIDEVHLVAPGDGWFQTVARMGRKLGLPVVAEGVFSSTPQETYSISIPAPRLVDEAYLTFMRTPGIIGIKEYVGINTNASDLNLDILQARLHDNSRSTDELVAEITSRFGAGQADARAYLDLISDAFQAYPWDASPNTFVIGAQSPDHGWSGATIRGMDLPSDSAFTPAWNSTRHARLMIISDDAHPDFWMLEDVELRCKAAADLLDRATDLYARLKGELTNRGDKAEFEQIQTGIDLFRRVSRSYALHLRETNVAQMLRQDLAAGRPMTAALVKELGQLLASDVANQQGHGRVVEMRRLCLENPEEFIHRYLITSSVPLDLHDAVKEPTGLTTRGSPQYQ